MDTSEELAALMVREFRIAPRAIEAGKPLAAYGLDSLALVDVLFAVEERFAIEIPIDTERVETLADLAALVDRLRLRRAA